MRASLSIKLGLAIIILYAVGNGLTAYIVYNNSTSALQASITSNLSDEAKQALDKMDRFLYERQVDMLSLSGRQQIQDFLAQPAARTPAAAADLVKQFDDFKVQSGIWSDLTLVDNQGNLPLGSSLQGLTNTLAKQPALLKLYSEAAAGQNVYTDALLLPGSHSPIMLFLAPVRDYRSSGQPVVGVLAGELAWQANLDILRTINGPTATLMNEKGLSLGENDHDSQSEVLSKDFSQSKVFKTAEKTDSGSGTFPSLDDPNQTLITSYVKESGYLNYQGNGWLLVLQTPRSVAFASAHQLDNKLILTFSLLFVMSTIALLTGLRFLIIKPISNLKEITGRLAEGDFSQRTTIKSNDELGRLGNDFNNMASKIQLANMGLRESNEIAQNDKRTILTLLENLPVGVLVVDSPSGKPIMMNRAAEKISGTSASTLSSLESYDDVYEVVKEDGTPYPESERPLAIALRTGQNVLKEDTYIKRSNHELLAVKILASPIKLPDGTFQSAVSLLEDISEDRNLERSREEFFSIASHELRTPLTAIRGNTSLIQQYYTTALKDPELKEMVDDIHESSVRLIAIVNDFLDTSRLEQKRVKFELAEIDIVGVAQSSIKEYVVTGSRRKIHLEVISPDTTLPKVWADNDRTKQVLINLVGNALKFTGEGNVTISFKIDGQFVKTLVTDTGQGMNEEAQRKLFRKFEQTGSEVLTRDSVRGTGLGLYISKMLVEQMNGNIALEHSEVGVGTTFSFSLPITKPNNSSTEVK